MFVPGLAAPASLRKDGPPHLRHPRRKENARLRVCTNPKASHSLESGQRAAPEAEKGKRSFSLTPQQGEIIWRRALGDDGILWPRQTDGDVSPSAP